MKRPFAPTGRLSPDLKRVRDYWEGLMRGSARIPFWDDFNPADLPDLKGRLFLIGVYPKPERYRFDEVGAELTSKGRREVEGLFADEVPPAAPFEFLVSQCSATTEAGEPTLYRCEAYTRLILPMWGDGRLSLLAGVVEWEG